MTTYAVLAEKPDMARKIVAGLGGTATNHRDKGYIEVTGSSVLNGRILVTFGFGHLIELANPDVYDEKLKRWSMDTLPIMPDHFKTLVRSDARKQYNNVKAVFDEANSIIIATDADREGENIAYEIIDQTGFRSKITKRLWINSNLPAAINKGFKSLRDAAETYPYYKESHSRSQADWLVGMNFTRYFTLKAQKGGLSGQVFSAGRVQTPVMALVVSNYLERKNFKPVPYFTLEARTEREGIKVTFKNTTKYATDVEAQKVMEENNLRNPYKGKIAHVTKEHKMTAAPELFDLAGIQSYANKSWGYTNDKTLALVQSLYDSQFVTYPRTEENKISADEFGILLQEAPEVLKLLGSSVQLTNDQPRKKYVGEYNAHSALMPTTKRPDLTMLAEDERDIYVAIAQRSMMMFAPDYEYDHTEVVAAAGQLEFKVTGNVATAQGWKAVQQDDQEETSEADGVRLPTFTEGEDVYLQFERKRGETKPPKPYTPSSLGGKNSAMEKLNLGTPATRANIIKTVVDRGYMKLSKNKYEPTDKGFLMYDLVKDSPIGSAEMTAKWEERLHAIEVQKEQPEPFIQDIKTFIREELVRNKQTSFNSDLINKAAAASSLGTCPKCKTGQIQESKKCYYCSNPDCNFVLWPEVAHKRLTKTEVKQLLADGRTKKEVTGLKGSKRAFSAYIELTDEFKTRFAFK